MIGVTYILYTYAWIYFTPMTKYKILLYLYYILAIMGYILLTYFWNKAIIKL